MSDGDAPAGGAGTAHAGAVVVGASGGLGAAFVDALLERGGHATVLALSRSGPLDAGDAPAPAHAPRLVRGRIDLTDEASVERAAALAASLAPPRLVIVATGLLHAPDGLRPEKSLATIDPGRLARLFAVNATGPALVAKHLLPRMPRQGRAVFAAVSARVGSISDNRLGGWYGYRASKAALNMLVKTAAIELRRTHPGAVLAALHPGTVKSALSKPFRGNDIGREPLEAAADMLGALDALAPEDSGCFLAYDGQRLPW